MRIVLLGAPGSGKGTQAQRLQAEEGLLQISTGDLLRQAVRGGSALGRKAAAAMAAGQLVSDEIVLGLIEERVADPDAATGFVLDGYPRNAAQAQDLERVLGDLGLQLDCAVLMDVGFDILLKRLTGRRTCSTTGKVLNIYFSPQAELDACLEGGGELLERDDDNEATIKRRLEVYEQETAPLIAHYRECGLLRSVSAEGGMDEVYGRLRAALGLTQH